MFWYLDFFKPFLRVAAAGLRPEVGNLAVYTPSGELVQVPSHPQTHPQTHSVQDPKPQTATSVSSLLYNVMGSKTFSVLYFNFKIHKVVNLKMDQLNFSSFIKKN